MRIFNGQSVTELTALRFMRGKNGTFVFLVLVASAVIFALGWFIWGQITILAAIGFGTATILALQLKTYHRAQRRLDGQISLSKQMLVEQRRGYKNVEYLFSLYNTIHVRRPLPPFDGWTISPAAANQLVSQILENRPQKILELGSGLSTLVSAYALNRLGSGMIISLESDSGYATVTCGHLERHNLKEYATVLHAPLKGVTIGCETWQWYDISALEGHDSFDMLVIDGPPGTTQKLARYPALPLLKDRLNVNAVIVLDDGNREEEKQIIAMWLKEIDGLEIESVVGERGTTTLKKRQPIMISSVMS